MPRTQDICIVIADGGHARLVKPKADNALHTVTAMDSISVHQQDSDLVSDRPGRAFESVGTARHAYTPRHDPHEMEKERFARTVAQRVNDLSAAGDFDALVLVAPPHVLNEMTDELDGAAKAKVIGTLAKDLANTPDDQLWPHLKQWVRPVHRA